MASPWKPGDQIVLREVWQGKVWTGRPVTVVQDEPDLLALFIPAGTPWRKPVAPDGGPLRLPVSEWVLADQRQPIDVLRLTTPGARHGVLVFWREGQPPFNGGWERWSPDPAWRIPELPEGWERHPC